MPKRTEGKFHIINLDHESGPCTHWVVLYSFRKKPIYFDSVGVWPPKELTKINNLMFNDYRIESRNSRSCGLYCIYVCDQLLAGRHFIDILLDFSPSDFMLNETKILNEMNKPLAAVGLGAKALNAVGNTDLGE